MLATQLELDDAHTLRATLRLLTLTVGIGLIVWLACLTAALAWAAPHVWPFAAGAAAHLHLPGLAPLLARGQLH